MPHRLLIQKGHLDRELPESTLLVFVQLVTLDLLRLAGLTSTAILQAEFLWDVARCAHDKHTAVPDRVVRVLPAHMSVVQQGTTDYFQSLARAADLRSVAHAIAARRDFVGRPWGHVGNGDRVAVGENAMVCGCVLVRGLYGYARKRSWVGGGGEEVIANRLRDAWRVALGCCCHCGVDVCSGLRLGRVRCNETIYSRANGREEVGKCSYLRRRKHASISRFGKVARVTRLKKRNRVCRYTVAENSFPA